MMRRLNGEGAARVIEPSKAAGWLTSASNGRATPAPHAGVERDVMTDKYCNFAELAKSEKQDRDFRIRPLRRESPTVIIAPHGGCIEPGTSEIAEAIAARDHSFYAFEGIKARGNRGLHITSSHFDEAQCAALVAASSRALAVHGEDSQEQVVYVGGLDGEAIERLRISLERRGFDVRKHPSPGLQGRDPANICNRTATGCGVQLELSKGLRRSFFQSLSARGRRITAARFGEFVAAVREALGCVELSNSTPHRTRFERRSA